MPAPGQAQRAASKFIVFEQFEKMNTQSVRQALSEKELAWLENLQPISPNNLTTVPAPLVSLTTIAETITSQYYADLAGTDYIISFTSVGGGWATNIATAVSTRFAPAGTFTNPDMTVWQSQYIIINDPTAGYCAWNGGSIFVRAGGVSPNLILLGGGSGFTSPPTVTITGGSGSGATATATIGSPQVSAVIVSASGSQYGPAPNVVFTGGGGTGAAAVANIDPRGVVTATITSGGTYLVSGGVPLLPSITVTGGGGSGAAIAIASTAPVSGLNPPGVTITGLTITLPGANYTSAPNVNFVGGTVYPSRTPATATCTVGTGGVLSVTITNNGSGYTSAPAVSFTGGGSGSGAAAGAVVGGSGVTSITLTNPGSGYLASDSLTVGFSGGGGGTGASASAHVWPFTTAGTTLAVFAGRVWLGGGNLLQYSGTQGFDDFSAANAAGSLTIKDADLVHAITALRNYNNYLFIMGDQSVKQIGSISVSGSTTLFTILTLSSDQGTIYKNSCGSFNRVFMFANTNGVYAVLGSSVQKVSDDMDGIFKLINFSALQPQAAIADINNIHHIAWLVKYTDPVAGARSVLLAFNGKRWFVISQGNSIVSITTASTLASGKTMLFSSSGSDITQLLGDPTTAVAFKVQTALSHHGNAVQRKKIINGGFAATLASGTGGLNVNFDTENGTVQKTYTLAAGFQFQGGSSGVEGSGRYLGMTITGTLAGFTFTNVACDYQEINLWTQ